MTLLLNGSPVVSARLSIPATGVWVAEVDIDLPVTLTIPSGSAALTIGTETLIGTVDPRSTGRLGSKATVQLVGGANGWDRIVSAQHFHNDAGVLSSAVASVTAAAVGEVVVDAAPTVLGVDYVRTAGAASRVLAGRPWYVDASGVTQIAARAPRTLGSDAKVLNWDPDTRTASLASDAIVWPGTAITDDRFGTATVRDVEQTFGARGARVVAWCDTGAITLDETPGSKLARAFGAMAREAAGVAFLRPYRYRVVGQGPDGRVTLQALSRGGVTPDTLQTVPIWVGLAGAAVKVTPGSIALVAFIDPTRPVVVAWDPDNTAQIEISLAAARVAIGAGTLPPVLASPTLIAWLAAVTAYVNGLVPGTLVPPTGHLSTKLFAE